MLHQMIRLMFSEPNHRQGEKRLHGRLSALFPRQKPRSMAMGPSPATRWCFQGIAFVLTWLYRGALPARATPPEDSGIIPRGGSRRAQWCGALGACSTRTCRGAKT